MHSEGMKKLGGRSPLKVKAVSGDPDTELSSLVAVRMIAARK